VRNAARRLIVPAVLSADAQGRHAQSIVGQCRIFCTGSLCEARIFLIEPDPVDCLIAASDGVAAFGWRNAGREIVVEIDRAVPRRQFGAVDRRAGDRGGGGA
jgi:hypothetical protein